MKYKKPNQGSALLYVFAFFFIGSFFFAWSFDASAATRFNYSNYRSFRTYMASTTEGSNTSAPVSPTEMRNWRNQNSALNNAIKDLSSEKIEDLPIPILFGIVRSDITPDFGDPRDGGARTHEGQDLISKTGIPVVSPTDAVVTKSGFGDSAGNYVYTANPGGETLVYMHLDEPSELRQGDKISRGDLIGFVGSTGNASGGVSHLHFEIHDDGVAVDPYPRLTGTFTNKEKIDFLEKILNDSSNPEIIANTLVGNYTPEFRAIKSSGVNLPKEIEVALSAEPASTNTNTTANGDLTLGSQGSAVTALQTYLIRADKGSKARALATAGATGYFGSITQAALIEFQTVTNLSANGVLSASTKTYIAEHPLDNVVPATGPVASAQTTTNGPSRDLTVGMKGDDVVWLQNYLIKQNSGVAARALAAAGATGYFGTITKSALAEYQTLVGITPSVGYFGMITRAYVNDHLSTR